jgi:hypothetical protein
LNEDFMSKALVQISGEPTSLYQASWPAACGRSLVIGGFSAGAVLLALGYSGTPLGELSGFFAYTCIWVGVSLLQHASGYSKGYSDCLQKSGALKRAAELASSIVNLIGSNGQEEKD